MKRGFTRLGAISLLLGLTACASTVVTAPTPERSVEAAKPLSVFLVRHAEKLTGDDPALTIAGTQRAEALADLLVDAKIEQIHSSDYQRTRDTAAPLAVRLGLNVALYDPRDLDGLVTRLRAQGGRHLVVGHSNTTPPLAELLGGDPGTPIVEATEYDRLYLVTMGADGKTVSTLLRYGQRSPSESAP